MSYIYHLAGENLDLAKAELEGFLRSKGIEEAPEVEGRIASTDAEPSQLRRLALVHEVSELIEATEELETDYRPEGSFAVRSEGVGEEVEEKLGELLKTEGNTVDLESPDETIKVYRQGDEYLIARLVEDIDRGLFSGRKNQERSFSSPVSLDPVLARVMVNLSEVSAEDSLLDPFCGTGGILIEAGLCGIDIYGLDVQEKMVKGSKKNLEDYGIISYDIREGAISEVDEIFDRSFDAVVTDLPYGHASKTEGEPVEKFLDKAGELTEGKVVFMFNEPEIGSFEADFEIYVHKNLTRYIYVLDQF